MQPSQPQSRLRHRLKAAEQAVDLTTKMRKNRLPRDISPVARSALARMLMPTSESKLATTWARVQNACCVLSIITYAASTVPAVSKSKHASSLAAVELAGSLGLTVDFAVRMWTCRERHRRYAHQAPVRAQLTWLAHPGTLLRLMACYPALSDGHASVTDYVSMLPRAFLLVRARWWRNALRTARRVLVVNRQILSTSLALVTLTILLSALLLHATCSTEPTCRDENGISDLPAAAYVAAMMLTGQASPEGGKELVAFRAVVLLTAFLSVPFFAVPAAMLTWGFEGEAARCGRSAQP